MPARLLLLSLLLCASASAAAARPAPPATNVRLPALFSDHMVLQRDAPIVVWGWADPGGTVRVTLGTQTAEAVVDEESRWRAELAPLPAGGPYRLTVAGAEERTFQDVMVGEVWVASGQSNMEWPVSRSNDAEREIARAHYPQLRLFTVSRAVSPVPLEDVERDGWHPTTPETVAGFSAVAYFFGRELLQELNVPIGLIHTSWGGTPAEAWTSLEGLRTLPDFRDAAEAIARRAAETPAESPQQTYAEALRRWIQGTRAQDPGYAAPPFWNAAAFDAAGWETMTLPALWEQAGLPDFDGIVWLRRSFDLPGDWAGQRATLHLGPIDDIDSTWVNGVLVGSTSQYNQARAYPLPEGLLRPGRNVAAVRVLDTGGGGGVYGEPGVMRLETAEGETLSLEGPWRYRAAVALQDLPRPPAGPNQQHQPTMLYNAMIAPLTPYRIRGAIWYQGESNASRAYQYRSLFTTLIRDWRARWDQGDFPFLFVQLANFMDPQTDPNEASAWAELREAQAMALSLPHTGMAVALDIGEADDIHPRNKQDVGKRLALPALANVYGRDLVHAGPTYQGLRREGNAIRLLFDHVGTGLTPREGPLRGFVIAGPDRRFVEADARIDGNTVLVSSPAVEQPEAVRYGWANNPAANLYNHEGLPAPPFRTDAWPGVTGP